MIEVTSNLRRLSPARTIALIGAACVPQVHAQSYDVVIEGQPVRLENQSIKCDLGELENTSIRRLADCHSAKLVKITAGDTEEQVVKFTIKPDDERISEGVRAELRDLYEAQNGEVTWYRFSTLLPEDFQIDAKHRLVLTQWHERMREGADGLRPPLSHRLWNGRFVVALWNKDRVAERGVMGDGEILFEIPEIERGVFYEFVYKIKWSAESDGEIDGWMRQCPILDSQCTDANWRQFIEYDGSTGYESEKIQGYYFKLGLYTVSEFDVPFSAYHRNYQIGSSAAEIGIDAPMIR